MWRWSLPPRGGSYHARVPVNLRHAVRAVILDERDRVLLCRLTLAGPAAVIWAAPGGGVGRDETPMTALRREIREETGLVLTADPPLVWRQRVFGRGYATGYDGVSNDYFLVRTASFHPCGDLSAHELAAEGIAGFHWWRVEEIAAHTGPELFSPRDLVTPLSALITQGPPAVPLPLGL